MLGEVHVPVPQALDDLVDDDRGPVRVDGDAVEVDVVRQGGAVHRDQLGDRHLGVDPGQQVHRRARVVVRERGDALVDRQDVQHLDRRLLDGAVERLDAVFDALAEVARLETVGLEAVLDEAQRDRADALDLGQAGLGHEEDRRDAATEVAAERPDDLPLGLVRPEPSALDELLDRHTCLAGVHGIAFRVVTGT